MDENKKLLAKKYEKIKLAVSISESIASFIIILLFLFLGYSKDLENYAYSFTSNSYIALLIYGFILSTAFSAISFPIDYFFGFKLEHKFNLSNLTFTKWLTEKFKAAAVGIVLILPLVLVFYWLISSYELWWFYLSCIIIFYSVILAEIAPVIIFPLFYKFTPIDNDELKQKLIALCNDAGFKVSGVFKFNMSKTTKKANAAFTGLGKTKRIILADTLLDSFSEKEIETVFAHELGHYKKKHIIKNIFISVVGTFAGLFIISQIYNELLPVFNFSHQSEIAALPLLALISTVFSFLTSPITSSISRKFEYEADRYALDTTEDFNSFSSVFKKLAEQNLADDEPNKLVEFWTYSHPSIKKRIQSGLDYFNQKFSSVPKTA
jgi:STE24 endopeptidase